MLGDPCCRRKYRMPPDVTGAFVKAVWPNLGTRGERSGSKACRLSPEDTWGLAREEGAACAAENRAALGRVESGSVGPRQGEHRGGRGEERQEAGTDPREPGSHSEGDRLDGRHCGIHWGHSSRTAACQYGGRAVEQEQFQGTRGTGRTGGLDQEGGRW